MTTTHIASNDNKDEVEGEGNTGRGTITIVKKYPNHCVLQVTRGVGPREIGEVWLPQQNVHDVFQQDEPTFEKCIKTIQLNPHYRAYARGLLLVARNKMATKSIQKLQMTIHCLCQGHIEPNTELVLEHTFKKSLCRIRVQGIQVVPSNTAGHISRVAISNFPGDPIQARQFRTQMKLNGTPILGNGQDAKSFRGETLCMSVVRLQFEIDGTTETIDWEPAPRLQSVLDREARFSKESSSSSSSGIPLAYQTGRCEFDGLEFQVNPSVMIPRPASETVVHRAVALYHPSNPTDNSTTITAPQVLDLGTGSGCLLLSILKRLPHAMGMGVDQSKEALRVASQNAAALGLDSRCTTWRVGEFGQLDQCLEPETVFDIVVCNPPYHTRGGRKQLDAATLAHEPATALFVDNQDRLLHYRSVVQGLEQTKVVRKGTVLVFEVFKDNANAVMELMQVHGWQQVQMGKDSKDCIRTVEGIYGQDPF